jgi:ketosteroid isomerase-like protein
MHKRVMLFLALMFVPSFAAAQQPGAEDRAALVAARDAVWRAWFTGDSLGLVAILPERMTGMGKHRAEIIADAIRFRGSGARLVSVTFTDDEFLVKGDAALVLSTYRVVTTKDGKEGVMTGRAIELFTREGERWINPYWHLDQQ